MTKLLTVDDLKDYLGISRATAYKLIHNVKYIKVGRRILVAEEDLLEYLQQITENEKTQNA